MQQNLDRVITRIDGRRERLPVCVRGADKFNLGLVAGDLAVEASYCETEVTQSAEQQNKERDKGAARPDESLAPLASTGELRATLPPAFRQKIELNESRRFFHADHLWLTGQNFIHGVAQFETRLV